MLSYILLLILSSTVGDMLVLLLSRGRPAAWRRRMFGR